MSPEEIQNLSLKSQKEIIPYNQRRDALVIPSPLMILEIFHVWVYHHHALLSRKMVTVHICMAFLLRLLRFIFIFQENSPTECHLWGISRFVNFLRSISSKLQDTSLQISCWDDLGWECFYWKGIFYGYAVEVIIIIIVVVALNAKSSSSTHCDWLWERRQGGSFRLTLSAQSILITMILWWWWWW